MPTRPGAGQPRPSAGRHRGATVIPLRDLIFGAILAGLIPVILVRPWTGVLGWYWVGLMNPHRISWGPLADAPLAMLVGSVTLVAMLYARERRLPPATPEMVLLLLFIGHFTIVTFLFSWLPDDAYMLWDIRIKIMLMTLVAIILVTGRERTTALMAVLALSVGYYGIKGGLFALRTGFSDMVLGPAGTFIGGNTDIGLALAMILPLLLILARQVYQGRFALPIRVPGWERLRRPIGLALYAGFWLTAAAVVGTHSRGAWVALAVVAPLLFLGMRFKLTMVALAVFGVGVVGVTVPDRMAAQWERLVHYEEDASAQGRIEAWNVAWNIAKEAPLTGSGFGTQRLPDALWLSYYSGDNPDVQRRAVHSIYFQTLGNLGFVGLALFLGILGFTLWSLTRIFLEARRATHTLWIAEWAWAIGLGIVAYAVAGAFLSLAYFDLYFAFVAAAIILRRELRDDRSSATMPVPAAAPSSLPTTERLGA